MADDEQNEEEQASEQAPEAEGTPDPGPGPTAPKPPGPTEEQQEQAAKEQAEAEDAARAAAEEQPEDPSVEAKANQRPMVNKEQFDQEWPTVAAQFPGVEPKFGKEEDGYTELLNDQAWAMAYATNSTRPAEVASKPERTKHGWEDFVDNSLPVQEDEEGDIEAKPKRRRQTKVTAGS